MRLKFLFADNKLILKRFFFLFIILRAVRPIEPVEPNIEIVFFFIGHTNFQGHFLKIAS